MGGGGCGAVMLVLVVELQVDNGPGFGCTNSEEKS